MAEKKNLRAPSGVAGLVRYDEGDDAIVKLKPAYVVAIGVAFLFIEIAFFLMFPL